MADICIHHEGTAEGFLGVDIVCTSTSSGPQITLLQVGLTKCIIEAVGLYSSLSTPIDTPAETSPLPKDAAGNPASGSFNYAAAVGMLLYLSDHSCLNIVFAFINALATLSTPGSRPHWALFERYIGQWTHNDPIISPLCGLLP